MRAARHHHQLSGHYKRQLSIWLRLTQSNSVVCVWRGCDIWQCQQMICESAPVTTCVFKECWSEKFVIWNSETTHADGRRNSTSLITRRNSKIISFALSGTRYRSRMKMHYNDRIINSKHEIKTNWGADRLCEPEHGARSNVWLNSWIDARSSKGLWNGAMHWEQPCSSTN